MWESRDPVAAFAFASAPEAGATFRPGEIWKDDKGVHINAHGGGFLFENGTYWWFGEHKVGGDEGNYAQIGVHAYSSKNLADWKDEGVVFAVPTTRRAPSPRAASWSARRSCGTPEAST